MAVCVKNDKGCKILSHYYNFQVYGELFCMTTLGKRCKVHTDRDLDKIRVKFYQRLIWQDRRHFIKESDNSLIVKH